MISDLVTIKRKLMDTHRKYEVPNADEYKSGLLTGIEVALRAVDEMLETEDERMAREYGED